MKMITKPTHKYRKLQGIILLGLQ